MMFNRLIAHMPLFLQITRFGIVGIIAATIHLSIVISLVQLCQLTPLVANVAGFFISFQVSYWGHKYWTFNARDTLNRIAFPKLLLIQLLNFTANELLFAFFLTLAIPYQFALFIVLTILPLFTFISSKLWVFRSGDAG